MEMESKNNISTQNFILYRYVMDLTIPDNAKRIYKGHHIELRNWEQQLFDNTVDTFEGLRIRDFVHTIVVRDNKILLAQEEQPRIGKFYSFVSGSIDDNYTPSAAAAKELEEEAGIVSHDLTHLVSFSGTGVVVHIHVFITKNFNETGIQKLEPGEKINLLWVSFEELLTYMQRDDRRAHDFNVRASKKYFIPGKHEEFKKLLFG